MSGQQDIRECMGSGGSGTPLKPQVWWKPITRVPVQEKNDKTPAWHDAPTEPGMWAWVSGLTGQRYFIVVHNIEGFTTGDVDRWCGPLPPDTENKA